MKNKDPDHVKDAMRRIANGEIETSFILGIDEAGERLYINNLEDSISALEFLEVMLAGYRAIVLEDLSRKFMN